ncbi:diguanylate cyclase domain-containing protein [Desulfonatronum thioautotrophicum]|uniref:diguanylate cyclase domain-containing protein n=1 Tax=Desulfonatronum thioautotrophicum TaxID=617001 RepID=UPI000AF860E0|nr:diguanylate cyclase [Desulfonatronum thioautotrophicum]
MFIKTPDSPASQMRLERQDLIILESELRQAMACFLSFSSYGLYFPSHPPQDMLVSDGAGQRIVPVFHAKEKKALLPLHRHGELLGIFVARNVSGKVTKNTLHLWSCLCDQIMDNLLLHKKTQVDPLTGLANAACLEENLAREIRLVHRGLWPDTPACLEEGVSEYSASVGLIFLDVDGFSRINERWGYRFGDHVLQQLGRMVARTAPEQAICARLREDTLAISFSGATAAKCHQLAKTFAHEAAAVYCENAINGERLQLSVSQGYVTYPQDFHGRQLRRSVREQTGVMLEKARRALRDAQEQGPGGIQGFSGILRESGMILDVLPMNRILVSLGRSVDAREGQRFLVWAAQSALPGGEPDDMEVTGEHGPEERICKAEIQLVDVLGETSVAEVVLQHDPGCALMPQDQLTILAPGVRQDVPGRSSGAEPGPAGRSASGLAQVPNIGEDEHRSALESQTQALLQVSDFSRYWTFFRQLHSRFAVMLIYLETNSIASGRLNHDDVEHMVRKLGELAAQGLGPDAVLGRFSFSTMACLIPDLGTEELETAARNLVRIAGESLRCAVSIGLAEYPYLHFSKADVLDNCRKALEHALMLPAPTAVAFCSTSLTVSADRAFSSGDIYSAVEEYKVALLADETNLLARNSLGVCYARLAKYGDALAQFSEVLRRDSGDIMATYNQGHTLLKQGEGDLARQAFERCLELDTQHVFSLIRLGQLAEQRNDLAIARDRYHRALLVPGGEGVTHRHLARLEMAEGNLEQAREHLHQALVHNPKDALAMHLLASMYLEHGDDPEIAETLARQSVALRPEVDAYWNVLARILERQGKTEEAAQAREQGDSPAC